MGSTLCLIVFQRYNSPKAIMEIINQLEGNRNKSPPRSFIATRERKPLTPSKRDNLSPSNVNAFQFSPSNSSKKVRFYCFNFKGCLSELKKQIVSPSHVMPRGDAENKVKHFAN